MGKTFTYTRQCGPSRYSAQTDEEFCDEEDFEFEVSNEDIREALSELIFDNYFCNVPGLKDNKEMVLKIKAGIKSFIWDNDFEDDLSDSYEDELKEYFAEQAADSWND